MSPPKTRIQSGYQYDPLTTTEAVFTTSKSGTLRLVSDGVNWNLL